MLAIMRMGLVALLAAGVLEILLFSISFGIEQLLIDKLGLEDNE